MRAESVRRLDALPQAEAAWVRAGHRHGRCIPSARQDLVPLGVNRIPDIAFFNELLRPCCRHLLFTRHFWYWRVWIFSVTITAVATVRGPAADGQSVSHCSASRIIHFGVAHVHVNGLDTAAARLGLIRDPCSFIDQFICCLHFDGFSGSPHSSLFFDYGLAFAVLFCSRSGCSKCARRRWGCAQ